MDSLADVVSFGAAPSLLAWHWGLSHFGSTGLFVCFLFCACGTIRLARFNVMASVGAGTSDFFLGLPIPAAAGGLVAGIITTIRMEHTPSAADGWIMVLVVTLSMLAISNVKFRTFSAQSRRLSYSCLFYLCLARYLRGDPVRSFACCWVNGVYVSSVSSDMWCDSLFAISPPDEVLEEGVEWSSS